jgi:hypothetical protein
MKEEKTPKDRYELTLAEFPIFLLSKKGAKEIEVIEYEDTIHGKDGEVVPRKWKVFPHADLGFPTASGLSTLYDLFQIWKECGFNEQYIQFGSIYNLLKRRKLTDGATNYRRIKKDLKQLVGITIDASNAFWDNERKAYVDMTFHLFDRVDFYKEKSSGQAALPFSRIKASDILYGSILKNSLFLTKFDSKFFHSLKPIEQRLVLYLSKIFRSQKLHRRELFQFASQVPLQVKEKKYIKRELKKAAEGLIKKEFMLLDSFHFEKGTEKKEFIVFKRKGKLPTIYSKEQKQNNIPPKEPHEIDFLVQEILDVCQDEKSTNFYKKVSRVMDRETIFRALSEVKEIRDLGEVKKSKGAIFTSLIKKYAQEQKVKL